MKPIINIKFDENEHGVYYSGQIVSGKVEISFSKKKKVRGIAIEVTGVARAQWKSKYRSWNGEGDDVKKRTRTSQFTGSEDYLTSSTYLTGSQTASPVEILPGIHTYNFACAIPNFAPSSFEGSFGYIRYVIKVVLERPWKFDQTYSVGFTVLKSLDLNYDSPLIRIPAEVEVIKKFWCCLCTTNPLHLKVKIPQTGFVPGQVIPIRIEINNGSSVKVPEVKFYLRKLVSYRADTPGQDYQDQIVELECKTSKTACPKGTIKFDESLIVPAVPPTSQFQSKVIQINYDIKVEAVVSGGHTSPFVICPITIGTVPLFNSFQQPMGYPASIEETFGQSQSAPSSYFQNSMPATSSEAPLSLPVVAPVYNRAPSTPNCNLSPPTYEESVVMTRARVDQDEEHPLPSPDYTPRYPVYNFEVPSAPQEFEIAEDVYEGKYPD